MFVQCLEQYRAFRNWLLQKLVKKRTLCSFRNIPKFVYQKNFQRCSIFSVFLRLTWTPISNFDKPIKLILIHKIEEFFYKFCNLDLLYCPYISQNPAFHTICLLGRNWAKIYLLLTAILEAEAFYTRSDAI